MMPKSVLTTINQEREKAGKETFANTRNATAGSMKLFDSGEVARRGLVCFIYDMLSAKDETGNDILCNFQNLNFPEVKLNKKPTTIQGVKDICLDPTVKQFLDNQDFSFDGLVIKIIDQQEQSTIENNLFHTNTENKKEKAETPVSLRNILGATNHHPRRGIAYKFPAEQASTQILSIVFQVGRS